MWGWFAWFSMQLLMPEGSPQRALAMPRALVDAKLLVRHVTVLPTAPVLQQAGVNVPNDVRGEASMSADRA